jgi:hypothetical protein
MNIMRIAVALLACLGAGTVTPTLADPTTEAAPTATAPPPAAAATAPAPSAASDAAAAARAKAAAQAKTDNDTRHFLALGYKPQVRGGEQIYCRKEIAIGSRLSSVKICGTIEELKLNEQRTQFGVSAVQHQQVNCLGGAPGKPANCGN